MTTDAEYIDDFDPEESDEEAAMMTEQHPNFVLVRLSMEIAIPQDAHDFLSTHRVDHADAEAVRAAAVDETKSWWEGLDCPVNIELVQAERVHAAAPWWAATPSSAP
jgi:hypothetical protein